MWDFADGKVSILNWDLYYFDWTKGKGVVRYVASCDLEAERERGVHFQ